MSLEESKKESRRDFLKGAAAGFGTALAGSIAGEVALIQKEINSHWLTPAAMEEFSKLSGIPYSEIEKNEPNLRRAVERAVLDELRGDIT